jgi:hypothetical protein
MGLFGRKRDPQALAAWETESARLAALPVRELAAEVLPAFGPNGIAVKAGHRQGPMEVIAWLLPDAPVRYRQPILGPVLEALAVLEHANLLLRRPWGTGDRASTYRATREGESALSDGTVREHLGIQAS